MIELKADNGRLKLVMDGKETDVMSVSDPRVARFVNDLMQAGAIMRQSLHTALTAYPPVKLAEPTQPAPESKITHAPKSRDGWKILPSVVDAQWRAQQRIARMEYATRLITCPCCGHDFRINHKE